MAENLELKARIASVRQATACARRLGATLSSTVRQTDVFLRRGRYRLKLRQETGRTPELIYYTRPDTDRPGGRLSRYLRIPVRSARKVLASDLAGTDARIVVEKRRSVWLYRNARIHIDRVRDLGTFLEFEVIVRHGRVQARRLLGQLVAAFGIGTGSVIAGAYADMLEERLQR